MNVGWYRSLTTENAASTERTLFVRSSLKPTNEIMCDAFRECVPARKNIKTVWEGKQGSGPQPGARPACAAGKNMERSRYSGLLKMPCWIVLFVSFYGRVVCASQGMREGDVFNLVLCPFLPYSYSCVVWIFFSFFFCTNYQLFNSVSVLL